MKRRRHRNGKPETHYKAVGLRWDKGLPLIQIAEKEGIDPFSNKSHLIDGQYVILQWKLDKEGGCDSGWDGFRSKVMSGKS